MESNKYNEYRINNNNNNCTNNNYNYMNLSNFSYRNNTSNINYYNNYFRNTFTNAYDNTNNHTFYYYKNNFPNYYQNKFKKRNNPYFNYLRNNYNYNDTYYKNNNNSILTTNNTYNNNIIKKDKVKKNKKSKKIDQKNENDQNKNNKKEKNEQNELKNEVNEVKYLVKIYEEIRNKSEIIKDANIYEIILNSLKKIKLEDLNIIIKILETLIYYRKDKIIPDLTNEELKKEAIVIFINLIKEINIKSTKKFFTEYITFFYIKDLLTENYSTKEKLSTVNNDTISLFFIKYFKLKENYSFEEFNIIKNNEIDYYTIIQLFSIYNSSEEEFLSLSNYILTKIEKKSFPFEYFRIIWNYIKKNKDLFNEKIKKFFTENFLEFPKIKTEENYINFYKFIFKNKLEIYVPQYTEKNFLEKILHGKKFRNCAFEIIKLLPKEKIKSLKKTLFKKILYSIDLENIGGVMFLLEYIPEELNNLAREYINKKKKHYLMKLIKKKKIKNNLEKYNLDDEIIQEINKSIIGPYYHHRIKTFPYNHIGILVEYVKNQIEFDIFFPLILNRIKRDSKTDINAIKELSYILNYAKTKNFTLPQINKFKSLEIIDQAKKIEPYTIKDTFGPLTPNCLGYTREEINVVFIDNYTDLNKNFDLYMKNTEFIGIDTEWRDSLEINVKIKTSIMQLSDFEGKNVLILDFIELNKEPNFEDNFIKLFMNKKFISYDFNSDLSHFDDKLILFFKEKAEIIDIPKIYFKKYKKNCPKLSKLCEEIFGKPLCKYEQCLNWEKRPLRESQLHYAAVDSIICCLIYKKIIDN